MFSLFYEVRNNLHDDKCHRMIWGSYLNRSKFNLIKNASIRESDQQIKIGEYSCIYVIIGALQELCMVFKTYKLYHRTKVCVWWDWHGCVYCDYITFPASINASGIDQRLINPWTLSTSSCIFVAEDFKELLYKLKE